MTDVREASIAAVGLRVAELRKAYADMVYHQLKGWVGPDASREIAQQALESWARRHVLDADTRDRVLSYFEPGRLPKPDADFLPQWAEGCDASAPTIFPGPGGIRLCRCIVCSRCGRHTGESNQGHSWTWCAVTKSLREVHFCCPDDCELEVAVPAQAEPPCGRGCTEDVASAECPVHGVKAFLRATFAAEASVDADQAEV